MHGHIYKTIFSSEKIEVSLVQKVDGKVQYQIMKAADVDRYCAKAEAAKVCTDRTGNEWFIMNPQGEGSTLLTYFLEKESWRGRKET